MNASTFVPRPAQEQVLAYTGGYMGISAVPGSGKTFTLSLLAARLVEQLARQGDFSEREVLIVTCTNTAVENFRGRIGHFLREQRGLLPGVGYRVRTLHGLAHDIVRERPALVGLSENFDIVDERVSAEIKRDSVTAYLRANPDYLTPYVNPDIWRSHVRWSESSSRHRLRLPTKLSGWRKSCALNLMNCARAWSDSRAHGLCWRSVCMSMPITSAAYWCAAQ